MSSSRFANWLLTNWYQPRLTWFTWILLPFSYLFRLCAAIRRFSYRSGLLKQTPVALPVIVIGNITVGGTGKTPFVIWLVELLKSQGKRPAVVSRGYGGSTKQTTLVTSSSKPNEVGEEPLLIYRRTGCPVVVAEKRVTAINYLIDNKLCDVIISDDGLQHYAMARDIEVVLIDGDRRLGNQQCLPAGPLREPISRLHTADFIVVTNGSSRDQVVMQLKPQSLVSITDPTHIVNLFDFKEKVVHAVAGIGNPERFFQTLRGLKLRIFPHPFPDHYMYSKNDIAFGDDAIVVMTEKDAVKCADFATNNCYFLPVVAELPESFSEQLLKKIEHIS